MAKVNALICRCQDRSTKLLLLMLMIAVGCHAVSFRSTNRNGDRHWDVFGRWNGNRPYLHGYSRD